MKQRTARRQQGEVTVPASCKRLEHWVLEALQGKKLELTIGSRRLHLTQERTFRLEDEASGFVFFMSSWAALERRLAVARQRVAVEQGK